MNTKLGTYKEQIFNLSTSYFKKMMAEGYYITFKPDGGFYGYTEFESQSSISLKNCIDKKDLINKIKIILNEYKNILNIPK